MEFLNPNIPSPINGRGDVRVKFFKLILVCKQLLKSAKINTSNTTSLILARAFWQRAEQS